jgi:virginiamycin B lyase
MRAHVKQGATLARFPRIAFLAVAAASLPALAMATTCTSNKPTPIQQDWTKSTFSSNKAKFTIFTGPTDYGPQLQITSGIDKSLWIAMTNNSAILELSTKGKATIYPTPNSGSAPEAIAANGKTMWFTEWTTSCAGSVGSSGKVAEYPTGISENMSTGMATGLSNTTWFVTDRSGIGKISNKGKVTIYPYSDEYNQPTAIALGPDGNMWFIENSGQYVGKITPTGTVTLYSGEFSGSGSGSFGIAAGSDGRIWFCDSYQNRIDAINTDGTGLTIYTTGLTGSPVSIAAGPDGNLYFGETTPVVGRITTAGAITEFPIVASEGSFPVISLAAGPDKNIWFSNNSHSQVGMLKLPIK